MKKHHWNPVCVTLCAVCALLAPLDLGGAMNVYLRMKANGTDIRGEPTVLRMGNFDVSEDIECTAVTHEFFGDGTTRLQSTPFKLVKAIDRASPLLHKAMDNAEPVEAIFRFFRPSREGDGTVVHYYTIQLTTAKISGIRTWFPNTMDPASTMYPHMEEVSIIFQSAAITFEETGITHTVTLTR